VFRSDGSVIRELPRFAAVYVATLVANLALLPIALRILPFSIYVDQALFLVVVVICSYLGHKYYSFGGGHGRDSGPVRQYDPEPVEKS
jgi:putative flippase GtrA